MMIALVTPSGVIAQQITFTAQVSDKNVVQNGVFDIQFILENAQGSGFQPPSFSDFKVVGGPSRGQSTTIINGDMSSSESYSYSLLATKKGKFTIGPASIVAGRKKWTSNAVVIEVGQGRDLSQKENTGEAPGDVILIAETEKKDYFPGQQIVLNYRILFTQNIQSLDILSEDDYADFFVQNFSEFSKQPAIVKINGKEYTSRIIKSIALYPHQSGSYTVAPLVMSVGINAPFSGIQGFFTMRRMQEMRVAADSLSITVLPLPSDAPTSFRGAVGQYTMKTAPGPLDITTNDALTFQLDIHGNGDSKRWDPPTPVIDSTFEMYDPKILVDQQSEANGLIDHHRTLEYQLIPKKVGRYKIFVPFTYFDPDVKKFVTLTSDTLFINVAQGVGTNSHLASNGEDDFQFEIQPLHSTLFSDRFWISWVHLLLFGLLLTGSCWGYVFTMKAKKEGRLSWAEKKRNAAAQTAISHLDELLKSTSSLAPKVFYEQASAIYYRFLCERLVIPPSDLDEVRLPAFLQRAKISDEVSERVLHLYKACLPIRYGGAPAGFSREEMVEECKRIIDGLATSVS